MGIHIAWITDTPLELPLPNFAADGEDLWEAVQNWFAGIGPWYRRVIRLSVSLRAV